MCISVYVCMYAPNYSCSRPHTHETNKHTQTHTQTHPYAHHAHYDYSQGPPRGINPHLIPLGVHGAPYGQPHPHVVMSAGHPSMVQLMPTIDPSIVQGELAFHAPGSRMPNYNFPPSPSPPPVALGGDYGVQGQSYGGGYGGGQSPPPPAGQEHNEHLPAAPRLYSPQQAAVAASSFRASYLEAGGGSPLGPVARGTFMPPGPYSGDPQNRGGSPNLLATQQGAGHMSYMDPFSVTQAQSAGVGGGGIFGVGVGGRGQPPSLPPTALRISVNAHGNVHGQVAPGAGAQAAANMYDMRATGGSPRGGSVEYPRAGSLDYARLPPPEKPGDGGAWAF